MAARVVDGPYRQRMLELVIAVLALAGSMTRWLASLRELAISKREAVKDWVAEDELIAGLPRRERRRERRSLMQDRDETLAREIRWLKVHVTGWALLVGAAAAAMIGAALGASI
jgi:hypothetical protein